MSKPLTVLKTVEDVDNAPDETVVETTSGAIFAIVSPSEKDYVKKRLPARVLRWGENYYATEFEPVIKTLADMTAEELKECQWMQCHTIGRSGPLVLLGIDGDRARLLVESGMMVFADLAAVTPRFDLPRLVWPGEESKEPPAVSEWVGRELRTWKDFGVAPVGTICADVGGDTALKRSENRWAYLGVTNTNDNMSRVDCGPFTVIAVAES